MRMSGVFDFVIADVFTDRAFGGNQLAVIPDATGLTSDLMQAIAREFNFAESSFVIPGAPTQPDWIRIFTPKRELPFVGHPTIGTSAVLSFLGRSKPPSDGWVTYEEQIGTVSTRVVSKRDRTVVAELRIEAALEQQPAVPDRGQLAAVLTIPHHDIVDAWCASVAVPFLFVRLKDASAVDRVVLDHSLWASSIAQTWALQLFAFCGAMATGADVYARMFAPAFGIEEDPASGAATLALAGVLAGRAEEADGVFTLDVRQGVALGRPSLMHASADKVDHVITRLRLAGPTVVVAQGSLFVP